ncbi:MAG: hypothetical protein U0Q21_03265 [Dermatophilaceae bacterium]
MPALPRALVTGLIDDAAVFPPAHLSLVAALNQHHTHRTGPYADLVGPLLLPPDMVEPAAQLWSGTGADTPLGLVVVSRPGGDLTALREAAETAVTDDRLDLRGVELGWRADWRNAGIDAPQIVLELPRGLEQALALTDAATAIAEAGPLDPRVLVKFRTGETPAWPWPDENELAEVLSGVVAMAVPVKLTGGLHHAIRGEHPLPDAPGVTAPQHGFLNILAAVAAAATGMPRPVLATWLTTRDAAPLVEALAALTPAAVSRVRGLFTAYGCCAVTDPIAGLLELGLLQEETSA